LRASQLRHTLDEQGEDANPQMRLYALRKPMKHWGHLDLCPLQRTKTALNDQKAFIAAGGTLQTDRIVIGFQHPFSILALRFADSGAIRHNPVVGMIRYVFTGAEKLKDETRYVYSERFGVRVFEG
jgi:hypothetical protein